VEEGRIAGLCIIMGFSKELYIFHLIDEYWICFSSSFEMSTGIRWLGGFDERSCERKMF
jgi:hypothetical protein